MIYIHDFPKYETLGNGELELTPQLAFACTIDTSRLGRPAESGTPSPVAVVPSKGAEKVRIMGWESQYPQYPDLSTAEANAQIDEAWQSRDTSHPLWDAAVVREAFRRAANGLAIDDPLVLQTLASASAAVLLGRAWDEAFRLPGRELPAEWLNHSPTDVEHCRLYLRVAGKMAAGSKVGTAVSQVSVEQHCSPEKVRKAYDTWRKKREAADDDDYGTCLVTLVREMDSLGPDVVPPDLRRDTGDRLIAEVSSRSL